MKKYFALMALLILASGCTTSTSSRQSANDLESAEALNLTIMVTDGLQISRSTVFSGEMSRLTLNLLNYAEVVFKDIRAILINADDLSPLSEYDHIDSIEPNRTDKFEWELTAPRLGVGEVLILNDMKVRIFYETYSTALKTLLLRQPGNRDYMPTYSESSKSPIQLYFDTSYESVPTLASGIKNFTVNMVLYNQFTGVVDYYNNSYYLDNYIKSIVLGIPKQLTFYNALDENSPWIKASSSDASKLNFDSAMLSDYDYYYIEFKNIEEYNEDYGFTSICDLTDKLKVQSNTQLNNLVDMTTKQKEFLWMTKGFTKINVLRFGAPTVASDTELNLIGRIDYSYSQDFGGDNFGTVIYGTG